MLGYTSLCMSHGGYPSLCMSHGGYTSLGGYLRVLYLPGCVPPGVIPPGSFGKCGPFYARFFGRMWPFYARFCQECERFMPVSVKNVRGLCPFRPVYGSLLKTRYSLRCLTFYPMFTTILTVLSRKGGIRRPGTGVGRAGITVRIV